jgi:hypothetical protein
LYSQLWVADVRCRNIIEYILWVPRSIVGADEPGMRCLSPNRSPDPNLEMCVNELFPALMS